MERQRIEIPVIILEWSEWYPWNRFLKDVRNDTDAIRVPPKPGVYEVRIDQNDERLTIGKASNLRRRVKQGLVKGMVPHSTGDRIRGLVDVNQINIRWAITDRPSACEEELHRLYIKQFGRLPVYTIRT